MRLLVTGEQLHGGEKVLYIRGEVAYNTARYWFVFRCRSVRSWDWRGAAGRRFCFVGGVASGWPVELPRTLPARESAGAGRLCRKGDFVMSNLSGISEYLKSG